MSNALSRNIAVLGGIASAAVLKWAFDHWLWDVSFRRLALMVDFEMAEPITAVLSYLVPLTTAALAYAVLSPHPPKDDRPALRKLPWQSQRVIVGLLVIVAATIGGLSLGRVFGLPSITLPQSR
jgi:amino acid transporter